MQFDKNIEKIKKIELQRHNNMCLNNILINILLRLTAWNYKSGIIHLLF